MVSRSNYLDTYRAPTKAVVATVKLVRYTTMAITPLLQKRDGVVTLVTVLKPVSYLNLPYAVEDMVIAAKNLPLAETLAAKVAYTVSSSPVLSPFCSFAADLIPVGGASLQIVAGVLGAISLAVFARIWNKTFQLVRCLNTEKDSQAIEGLVSQNLAGFQKLRLEDKAKETAAALKHKVYFEKMPRIFQTCARLIRDPEIKAARALSDLKLRSSLKMNSWNMQLLSQIVATLGFFVLTFSLPISLGYGLLAGSAGLSLLRQAYEISVLKIL